MGNNFVWIWLANTDLSDAPPLAIKAFVGLILFLILCAIIDLIRNR